MPLGSVVARSVVALGVWMAAPIGAAAQEFAVRTVNVVVGFPPGGGYDTYARLLARHMGRHLPGTPSLVVQNMPGGGSLNLTNAIANTLPADGSNIALVNSAAALEPVLGNAQAKFETTKLVYIGNMNSDAVSCAAWHTSGIATWDDAVKKNGRFGGVGAAGTSSQHAFFMKNVLAAPISVITGYRGTNEINLGLQRGEVDVSCGLFVSSLRGAYRADYEAGNLKAILQFGKTDEPYFKGASNIYKLLRSEEDRTLTEFIFGQAEISRPVIAPPAVPDGVRDALRRAFDATMKDAEFLAEAKRGNVDIAPVTGADTAAQFARFAAVPPAIAARAKAAISP